MKKISIASCGIFITSVTLAQVANVPASITFTESSKKESQSYIGLNWQLGGGLMPALVFGVIKTKVKSNRDTVGVNFAFHLNLAGGVSPGKIKLSGLQGQENLQAELAAGYDFLTAKPFIGLGVNAPYIAVGINKYLDSDLLPYVTIHSLGSFNKPNQTTNYNCASDYTLIGADCVIHIITPAVTVSPEVAPPAVDAPVVAPPVVEVPVVDPPVVAPPEVAPPEVAPPAVDAPVVAPPVVAPPVVAP